MIVSKLTGGLGNQLHMYSFGRALAEKVGTDYYVSNLAYKEYGGDYTLHKYVLNRLRTPPKEITGQEMVASNISRTLTEKRLRYSPSIWDLAVDDILLDVYAGDYRYSEPIISRLRAELYPLVELKDEFKDWYDELTDGNTVSIHVRLQDYIRNPHCLNLPVSYYTDALQVIRNAGIEKPRLYLFTDEPNLVIKKGFSVGVPYTIVSHGADYNLEDMSLMSSCKHHICANSSFSFWAAWLDGKGGGITIVPDKYHKENGNQLLDTYGEVVQPSYPPDWNVIPVRMPT